MCSCVVTPIQSVIMFRCMLSDGVTISLRYFSIQIASIFSFNLSLLRKFITIATNCLKIRIVDTRFTGEIMVHLKIYNLSIGTGAPGAVCEETKITKGISKIAIKKGKIMTIVSNNSLLFNMEMDFWKFNGFDTEGLLGRWSEIYDLARENHTEDAAFFLADCMAVLYEKVLSLPDPDRIMIIRHSMLSGQRISPSRILKRMMMKRKTKSRKNLQQ